MVKMGVTFMRNIFLKWIDTRNTWYRYLLFLNCCAPYWDVFFSLWSLGVPQNWGGGPSGLSPPPPPPTPNLWSTPVRSHPQKEYDPRCRHSVKPLTLTHSLFGKKHLWTQVLPSDWSKITPPFIPTIYVQSIAKIMYVTSMNECFH